MPLAQRRGEPYHSHADLKKFARLLSQEYGEKFFQDGFESAEKFHIYYYHAQMDAVEFADRLSEVRVFVTRLLQIAA